jgi:hypothetical protein
VLFLCAAEPAVRLNRWQTLKSLVRIIEKAALNGNDPGDHRGVFDVVRGMVVCPSLSSVAEVLRNVAACDAIELVRMKERFFAEPSPGGWRDFMACFVMKADDTRHVCELQIAHVQLLTARKGLPGHSVYNQARNAGELLEFLRGCRTTAFVTPWTCALASSGMQGAAAALRAVARACTCDAASQVASCAKCVGWWVGAGVPEVCLHFCARVCDCVRSAQGRMPGGLA